MFSLTTRIAQNNLNCICSNCKHHFLCNYYTFSLWIKKLFYNPCYVLIIIFKFMFYHFTHMLLLYTYHLLDFEYWRMCNKCTLLWSFLTGSEPLHFRGFTTMPSSLLVTLVCNSLKGMVQYQLFSTISLEI